jgi:hypothetical protein
MGKAMHETEIIAIGGYWYTRCHTCDWEKRHRSEISAMVAADHHRVMTQPNARDRLVFLRLLIPYELTDWQAVVQVVAAIRDHTDVGVTRQKLIG